MLSKDRVYVLEIIHIDGVKTQYINKPTFLIGRGTTASLKIDDSNVSREHLKVFYDGVIKIQDLDTSNGTFVNNKRIPTLLDYKVSEHDVITLGKGALSFKINTFTPYDEVSKFTARDDVKLVAPLKPVKQAKSTPKFDVRDKTGFKPVPVEPYENKIELLVFKAKNQMKQLQAETESQLEKKKIDTAKEIEMMWQKHREQLELEKTNLDEDLKIRNQAELALEKENLRNELFIERNKLLNEAEAVIQAKKEQFEKDKAAQVEKVLVYKKQIAELKAEYKNIKKTGPENKWIKPGLFIAGVFAMAISFSVFNFVHSRTNSSEALVASVTPVSTADFASRSALPSPMMAPAPASVPPETQKPAVIRKKVSKATVKKRSTANRK